MMGLTLPANAVNLGAFMPGRAFTYETTGVAHDHVDRRRPRR